MLCSSDFMPLNSVCKTHTNIINKIMIANLNQLSAIHFNKNCISLWNICRIVVFCFNFSYLAATKYHSIMQIIGNNIAHTVKVVISSSFNQNFS